MDLAKLQELAGRWREKVYPGSTEQDIAQKVAEEAGEVNGASFKRKWAKSPEYKSEYQKNLYEEIGDTALTLLSLCQYEGWDFEVCVIKRAAEKGMLE